VNGLVVVQNKMWELQSEHVQEQLQDNALPIEIYVWCKREK